ncbi:MAG: PSD1 and planctomycete cytochrome C domain-containing protein [Phycisphaerales bacterium]
MSDRSAEIGHDPRRRARRRGSIRLALLSPLPLIPLLAVAASRPSETVSAPADSPARSRLSYNRDVRPILSDHCFQCHGPDSAARQANLRLDVREDALRDRDGFRAIDLEDPDASEILHRIASDEPDLLMPPAEIHKPLSEAQKAILARWIAEGAEYEPHWSYLPPREIAPPRGAGLANPIDAFVVASLREQGLEPSPQADPATLLRRVSLDLNGLPPSLEELDAFERDVARMGADRAYEVAVERLLASPRYGEHWAREWLDAARYGDTHGLHLDNERVMWPYRDWVVAALNENKPFDEFSIEQLAGDLLPDATLEQQVASGFVRCHVTTSEGGSINEEYLVKYAVDRTEAFATIWLGMTAGCAACHDHKYDPLSQAEFYGLYAFFNSTTEAAMDGNAKAPPPVIKVPSPLERAALEQLAGRIETLRADRDGDRPDADALEAAWSEDRHAALAGRWRPLVPSSVVARSGVGFSDLGGGVVLAQSIEPATDAYVWTSTLPADLAAPLSAIRLDAIEHESLEKNGPGGGAGNGNFVLTEILLEVAPPEADPADDSAFAPLPIAAAVATWSQNNYPIAHAIDGIVEGPAAATNGWAGLRDGDVTGQSAIFAPKDSSPLVAGAHLKATLRFESQYPKHQIGCFRLVAATDGSVVPIAWSNWQLAGPIDFANRGEALASGTSRADDPAFAKADLAWAAKPEFVDGAVHPLPGGANRVYLLRRTVSSPEARRVTLGIGSDDGVRVHLDGEVVHDNPAARGAALDQDRIDLEIPAGEHELVLRITDFGGACGFAFRVLEESLGPEPLEVATALAASSEARSDAERASLRRHFRQEVWPEGIEIGAALVAAEAERKAIDDRIPTTLVAAELMTPRPAHILNRGEYDQPRDRVERHVPAVLPPMRDEHSRDRLGLAQWLFEPGHPLTARVTVNRLWQRYFGEGLVETVEDFGSQGALPSHPELLDFLATWFEESGWDLKALHRLIVTSGTYRQRSAASEAAWAADPNNRTLARGPRMRLDAEAIRDLALFTSGLLVEKLGGPPVKPYQPEGVWEAVAYVGSNTQRFSRDMGDALWRRSLYTFWKRTAPPPSMATFDAPNRESCVVERERTNTPLAALVLLNDEQFVEAARHLGLRMLEASEAGGDDAAIDRGFRIVLSRLPDAGERASMQDLLRRVRTRFFTDPEAARALLSVGERPGSEAFDPVEQASYAVLGSVLLNLDEAISKG